ncbi:hypothetical protein C0J45_9264 [Silurus meridionalis]|nr:hypothetical protein C0J45_9264 [Silurus meridionalis]
MEDQLQQNQAAPAPPLSALLLAHSLHTTHPTLPSPPPPIPSSPHSNQYTLSLTEAQVRLELRKIKVRKAAGPDGISSRLLKTCADQLCGMLYKFDQSLELGKVPQLWKTSCVVPVPKTSNPKDFGHYRPVALTSHLMKTLERLVLTHLQPLAILHLEKAGNTVRVTFFDFSSAFNTTQPVLLRDKMVYIGVDHHLSTWILDYLTDRPHLVGLITDDDDRKYRELIQNFVDWCQQSCLQINMGKTKELVVDFHRHKQTSLPPVNIQGKDIVRVDSYKYLSVHLNSKLDWTDNTEAIYKKGQSRLFLLKRLSHILWYGLLVQHLYCRKKEIDKLIRKASSVLGIPLETVQEVEERRMLAKLSLLLENISHPLYKTVSSLSSSFSDRLLHTKCLKERYRRSFLPAAIRLYNQRTRHRIIHCITV